MKNLLGAVAIAVVASFGMAASASAAPAVPAAAIVEQASQSVEQVSFKHRHRFHGRYYFGGFRHYYGGGDSYWFRRYCYFHPYSWKCGYYGHGY